MVRGLHDRSKRLKAEDGLTLVELLISMTMAVVITAGAAAMLIYAVQRQGDLTQRADQVGEAQVQMERMVRGIRQGVLGTATVTTTASSSKLKLETYVDGNCGTTAVTTSTKCLVVYECASEACSRTTGSSTTKTETMLKGVKNASTVFEGVTGPSPCTTSTSEVVSFVEVKLELKSKKGGVTKLQNGGGLRSCS
jgi:type II secretory pathway pseudopilin PulG